MSAGEALEITTDVVVEYDTVNGIQIMPARTGLSVGESFCDPAVSNSSGRPAFMSAQGSTDTAANDLTILCGNMPVSTFGFFVVSQTQGFVTGPGGSSGNLCLAGSLGRYVGAGQIQNTGSAGSISLLLDLAQVPQPTMSSAVQSGETWHWQTWFRDTGTTGASTSNFSDGLQIDF